MKFNLVLTCLENYFIIANPIINNQDPTFTITDTKLYVAVVTLLTQDNAKQLKSRFKRTIN